MTWHAQQLADDAGLDSSQMVLLLESGTLNVRRIALKRFPKSVDAALEAYIYAITCKIYIQRIQVSNARMFSLFQLLLLTLPLSYLAFGVAGVEQDRGADI